MNFLILILGILSLNSNLFSWGPYSPKPAGLSGTSYVRIPSKRMHCGFEFVQLNTLRPGSEVFCFDDGVLEVSYVSSIEMHFINHAVCLELALPGRLAGDPRNLSLVAGIDQEFFSKTYNQWRIARNLAVSEVLMGREQSLEIVKHERLTNGAYLFLVELANRNSFLLTEGADLLVKKVEPRNKSPFECVREICSETIDSLSSKEFFVAGTLVKVSVNGMPQYKPIEEVREGDWVYCLSKQGFTTTGEVKKVKRKTVNETFTVELVEYCDELGMIPQDSEVIKPKRIFLKTGRDQRFFSLNNQRWLELDNCLRNRDADYPALILAEKKVYRIYGTTQKKPANTTGYFLEIDCYHNFYATEEDIVVHNSKDDSWRALFFENISTLALCVGVVVAMIIVGYVGIKVLECWKESLRLHNNLEMLTVAKNAEVNEQMLSSMVTTDQVLNMEVEALKFQYGTAVRHAIANNQPIPEPPAKLKKDPSFFKSICGLLNSQALATFVSYFKS